MRIPENIPPELFSKNASNDMLLFTAAISIIIGLIMIWLGKRGKQMWMVAWSIGLIICSLLMVASVLFFPCLGCDI